MTPTQHARTTQMESVLREWLEEPALTLVCGDWRTGSIMELLPNGDAVLTEARYPEPFSGLRDLHLPNQGHHLHIDLNKLSAAVYSVVPSICYGYRPSFEVHFIHDGRDDLDHPSPPREPAVSFALAVRDPYRGGRLNRATLIPYFRRLIEHHQRYPLVTGFRVEPSPGGRGASIDGWREAHQCLAEACGASKADGPELDHGPESLSRAVRRLVAGARDHA